MAALSTAFAAALTGLGETEPAAQEGHNGEDTLGGDAMGPIAEHDVEDREEGEDAGGGSDQSRDNHFNPDGDGYDVDDGGGGGDGATEDSSSWGGGEGGGEGGGRGMRGHARNLSMDESIGATSEEDGYTLYQEQPQLPGSDEEEGNSSGEGGYSGPDGSRGGFGHFVVTPLGVARAVDDGEDDVDDSEGNEEGHMAYD